VPCLFVPFVIVVARGKGRAVVDPNWLVVPRRIHVQRGLLHMWGVIMLKSKVVGECWPCVGGIGEVVE